MRSLLIAAVVGLVALVAAAATSAAPLAAHGQLLQPAFQANQSSNWFGYVQGALEQGGKQFNSIGGDWTVPAATQHTAGQAESSSDWIGIGGGCVDAGCAVGDNTLIQTGTEQDVDASGAASYSAWWEIIPGPSIAIPSLTVAPGDHLHATIAEAVAGANVWTITLQNVTRGESYSTTVPYSSTHLTAEWIEETPLLLGADAGFASLPNLTDPVFTRAVANGVNANLQPSEEMLLADANGNVIGAPSAPNATHDGFSACTWGVSF
jgi:hypothetical protein